MKDGWQDQSGTNRECAEYKECVLDKKQLRRKILKLREALSEEERYRAAVLITERIAGHQWFYCAENLLGFVGYGSEIDTRGILQEALDRGKKVYVPKVEGEEMVFYRIYSLDELTAGYKGIPEPEGTSEIFAYPAEEKTLMIMPGAAFDSYGNRVGYGKGFYDRYLACREGLCLCSIAVGFKCQMVERVPAEDHDIKPCQIICV